MRKAELKGAYNIVVTDVPKPEVGPGGVLVKVKYCSICGSDTHMYKYDLEPGLDDFADSWLKTYGFPPQIYYGHQYCGVVEAVGEGVQKVKVGDRVTGEGGGAYADYILIPSETMLVVLPDSITWEQAAFLEPLNVAINAVRKSRIKLGDKVVVMGFGSIGNLVMQCARAAGAGQVIVTEMDEKRLALAKKLGADEVINVKGVDVVEKVTEVMNGNKPDIVFECTGVPALINTMIDLVKVKGKGIIVASYEKKPEIAITDVMVKNLEVIGSLGDDNLFEEAITLVESGRVNVDCLNSAIMPLEKIDEAMKALLDKKEIGIILQP
jgi:(R,R)-butanediol dehydrogenase/meso-butanediol dehydrogenase/diacetyl reductase